MSTKLVTVGPNTELDSAKELLQEHKIEKLLVVAPDGMLPAA
jgi:CBS domain-containing protein